MFIFFYIALFPESVAMWYTTYFANYYIPLNKIFQHFDMELGIIGIMDTSQRSTGSSGSQRLDGIWISK